MADAVPAVLALDERFGPIAKLSERLAHVDLSRLLVYLVDLVEDSALPHLAAQFHILGDEGWLLARTDRERRRLIQHAIELHRHKGTRWAVEQALRTLGIAYELVEWWQQQPPGAAHTFDLLAWVNENITGESTLLTPLLYEQVKALVDEFKPARSHYQFRVGARFANRIQVASATSAYGLARRSSTPRAVQPPVARNDIRIASATNPYSVQRTSSTPIAVQPRHSYQSLRIGSAVRAFSVVRLSMEA